LVAPSFAAVHRCERFIAMPQFEWLQESPLPEETLFTP
jgi:hypothetical protein